MTTFCCRIATTKKQLDDAARVRWRVFGEELGLLRGPTNPVHREVNVFDTLDTTVHFVVYADGEPVATARLLLPNPEVASTTGGRLGIDLEQKLDLSDLDGPGLLFAETTRFCILKAWRYSEALWWLQDGLYRESRRRGVTHWIASANMDTDSPEDARLVFRVASRQGLLSARWRALALSCPGAPHAPSAPLYTPEQRALARQGQLEGLRMPRVISFLSRRMGARFMAEPLYDAGFHRFSLPLVAALDEVPASTLARFEALNTSASHA